MNIDLPQDDKLLNFNIAVSSVICTIASMMLELKQYHPYFTETQTTAF